VAELQIFSKSKVYKPETVRELSREIRRVTVEFTGTSTNDLYNFVDIELLPVKKTNFNGTPTVSKNIKLNKFNENSIELLHFLRPAKFVGHFVYTYQDGATRDPERLLLY